MDFTSPNIWYLEQSDFQGSRLSPGLVNPQTGKPYFSGKTILLLQSNSCGHCTSLKPTFQRVADQVPPQIAEFATIQVDGGENLDNVISAILQGPLNGVPMVLKLQNGALVDTYRGDRSEQDLGTWSTS